MYLLIGAVFLFISSSSAAVLDDLTDVAVNACIALPACAARFGISGTPSAHEYAIAWMSAKNMFERHGFNSDLATELLLLVPGIKPALAKMLLYMHLRCFPESNVAELRAIKYLLIPMIIAVLLAIVGYGFAFSRLLRGLNKKHS
jgi:hypothetical protein